MSAAKLLEQNSISQNFDPGLDLSKREELVTTKAFEKFNFKSEKLIGKSSYWGSDYIGAIHYLGEFQGKKVVLKIQGIEMNSSEVDMIHAFEAQNKSQTIRTPKIFDHIKWSEKDRFEAYIMEYVEGNPIIGLPAMENELDKFFSIYREYRKNCLNVPWVKKPSQNISEILINIHEKWKKGFQILFKDNPFWLPEDENLISKGLEILVKNYEHVDLEFQHGHFSRGDVLQKDNGEIILFSNLLWGWKVPFYDAVFANHWSVFQLSWLPNPTIKLVDEQRKLWLNKVYGIPKNDQELRLLNLALLERAVGALRIDAFTFDPKSPIAKYLVESAREQVHILIDKIS